MNRNANVSLNFLMALLIGVCLLAPARMLQAQDDPRYDHQLNALPPEVFNGSRPAVLGLEVITDDEGFDNFDMGVDVSEPHVTTNPLAPQEFFNAWNINAAYYTHNGFDWTRTVPPFAPYSVAGDPVTAYDSLGNLFYMSMYGSISGAVVIRSTDNGINWSAPSIAVSGVDKCWMAADQTMGPYANYVYAVMTGGPGGNFSRSTDHGATWQTTFTTTAQSLPGMMVAVGPDVLGGNNISGGCVYVVAHGGSTTAATYTFYRSTNGGATFDLMSAQNYAGYVGTFVGGRHSVENMRTRPYPFITADNSFGPYRGRLYLVYAKNEPDGSGFKPDIWCRYSDDQGATWTSATRINDDPNPLDNHQWAPAIWCDKETGRLYAKWYDSRRDPNSDSTDVYASYSDDGGVTWAPNQRITTENFKIDCTTCGGGTPRYQGDYDAITSNYVTALAVWGDFRNGNMGSYSAYFPDFAMTVSAPGDTIGTSDSMDVVVKVPAVKLYDYSVTFSAEVTPAADISFSFPDGNQLTSYPDSLRLRIKTNNVPLDEYAVIITGEGPNGTPVHKREVRLISLGRYVGIQQPNGGESLYANGYYSIRWTTFEVDTVDIEFSADGGATWNLIAENYTFFDRPAAHPKARVKPMGLTAPNNADGVYYWNVPDTLSGNCLVRINASDDSTIVGQSAAPFSIVAPPAAAWQANSASTSRAFYTVSLADTAVAWAAGENGSIYRTIDGGRNWQVRIPLPNVVYNLHAVSADVVYAAASDPGDARIYRSTNGGFGWHTVYSNDDPAAFLNYVTLFDDLNGYAMGDPVNSEWTLLRTTDGGDTWEAAASLAQNGSEAGWNNAMWWADNQNGWFGTNNGRVYRTTDGGSTWDFAATSFTNSLAVSFADPLNGLAGGEATDESVDGGASWSQTAAQIAGTVFGSAAVNLPANRWYLVSGGEVYRSNNQGGNFQTEFAQANTYNAITMKVVRVDDNDWICGYAVGDNGTITRYLELVTPTGVAARDDVLPGEYQLHPNFPNPFNPTTTIRYQLPGRAEVNLKIFNVLGQEVVALQNGAQPAGNYEIAWDGRNTAGKIVASGLYFYRLEATDANGERFQQIRKMLLLK